MEMNDSANPQFGDDERRVYAGRANVLIPSAEGMPSAEEAGVHLTWIDEALAARPDLVEPFFKSLSIGPSENPEQAVSELHAKEPELFDAFSVLTAGAYLMIPAIRELIGYPGQEARPVVGDDMPLYLDMLEKVVERGPVYRPTLVVNP